MSLKPIDIQTLFAKLNDVGKNQANIKTVAMVSQDVAAREQAQEELRKEHSVSKLNDKNDISKVNKREEQRRQGEGEGETEEETERDPDQKSPPRKDLFVRHDDPDVGKNIDVKS